MFERWKKEERTPPLNKSQRTAILARDNNSPQQRGYNEEKGWHKSHNPCPYDNKPCDSMDVHHIDPARNGGGNDPKNLLTVSSCFHTGRCRTGRVTR